MYGSTIRSDRTVLMMKFPRRPNRRQDMQETGQEFTETDCLSGLNTGDGQNWENTSLVRQKHIVEAQSGQSEL